MAIETEQQAIEALIGAQEASGNLSTTDQANLDAREQVAKEADKGTEGTTEVTDSFTGLDPNTLPEEVRPFYTSMQADYTRKQQALAEERKQYEALEQYGGAEAAVEAVRFAQALATDPQFALGVHEQLTQALTEAGLTPAQASAEASRQIDEAAAQPDEFGGYEDERGDPESERIKVLEAKLSEFDAWKQGQEEREIQAALANEIMAQENEITRNNPDYTEQDIGHIYDLAYATGGNLIAAEQKYREFRNELVSAYIEQKSSVPTGVTPTPDGGNAETPKTFTDLNDPELEKLAQQYLAQQIALGNA